MMLDRSRPYSQTIGESFARFHQDGKDFNSNGEEVNPAPVVTFVEPPAPVAEAPRKGKGKSKE